MSETAGIEQETTGPVLLWEGQAAMFASPGGGRVIRYDHDGEEKFVAIPAELVPALEMLRANPGALVAISQNKVLGPMAQQMATRFARKAEAAIANGNG
jgi:hypothetical protein